MSIKATAHQLVENLAEDSTWEDPMYQIYVREVVEQGLEDSRNDRVHPSAAIREHFGLAKP
ncbi:MAG: hypothetical protein ACK41E_00720 [Deinococcales bacterium]